MEGDMKRSEVEAAVKAVAELNGDVWDGDRFVRELAVDAIMAGTVAPNDNDGFITDPVEALAYGAYVSNGAWWVPA
jgi:hypothetical protein